MVFECKVKHDTTLFPTMTWLKDDGELPDDERLQLFLCLASSEWLPGCKTRSRLHVIVLTLSFLLYRLIVDADSLTINDVTEGDAGVYTCIMNTTLDQDSASAELTVVGMLSFVGA